MNDLQVFKNSEFGEIRTLIINDEPWFVGKDVAQILGYKDTSDCLKKHIDDEDKMSRQITDSLGRSQNTYLINESGLYSLVLSSKLPTAKQFKRWVTSEVLPSIRKHGIYATSATIDNILNDPDFGIKLLTQLKNEREKNKSLESKIIEDKPKVLFADSVSASETSILIGDLAKLIKQNGVDTGQKRLFDWLRENGYLMKSGDSRNMPTQKSMELGLFEVKETVINCPDNNIITMFTTKVTGKGQSYFIGKFIKKDTKSAE